MTTQQHVADYVRRRVTVGRVQPGANYWHAQHYLQPYGGRALPEAGQLAAELMADSEFRALQIGGFLNTPTGGFVEQAVALAVPKAITPEFELIVDALKLAADLQQGHARTNVFLGAAGIATLAFAAYQTGSAA